MQYGETKVDCGNNPMLREELHKKNSLFEKSLTSEVRHIHPPCQSVFQSALSLFHEIER
jgi:hypothetical protein